MTKRLAGGGHVGLVAFHTTTCSGLMSGPRAGRSLRGVLVPAEKHDEFELKVEPPNYEDPKLTDLYHEPRKLTTLSSSRV